MRPASSSEAIASARISRSLKSLNFFSIPRCPRTRRAGSIAQTARRCHLDCCACQGRYLQTDANARNLELFRKTPLAVACRSRKPAWICRSPASFRRSGGSQRICSPGKHQANRARLLDEGFATPPLGKVQSCKGEEWSARHRCPRSAKRGPAREFALRGDRRDTRFRPSARGGAGLPAKSHGEISAAHRCFLQPPDAVSRFPFLQRRAALASEGCYPGPPPCRRREANMRSVIPAIPVLAGRDPFRAEPHTPPSGRNGRRPKSLSPRCSAPAKALPTSPVRRYSFEAVKAPGRGSALPRAKCKFPRRPQRLRCVREKYPQDTTKA